MPASPIASLQTVQAQVMQLHGRQQDLEEGDLLHRLDRFNAYELRSLAIAEIDLDEFDVDHDKVESFMRLHEEKGECPPIVYDSIACSMIDGIHRANAVACLGRTTIEAWVGVARHLDLHWAPLDCEEDC